MQNAKNNNTRSMTTVVRHGVMGWYLSAGNTDSNVLLDRGKNDSTHARYSARSADENRYNIGSTGTVSSMPERGSVVVCGKPYFRDKKLSAIARESGAAAAVAWGYKEYTDNVFSYIFGSFCAAIIDTRADRVLIGIDRLGQQTLYYSTENDTLIFADSPENVSANCTGKLELLDQGIYNYLYFHMVPCPGTAYARLKKIPAAHFLEYAAGRLTVKDYWRPKFLESTKKQSIDSLSKDLKETLGACVEKALPATGKVGSFLSGGLDSSTVTGLLAELGGGQPEAYSIGFAAKGYDEMAFARITARHFGVHLNEYYVTPQDIVDALPAIAAYYDEPFGNSSALPAYFCAKMAAGNDVNVLLAGDGGDEIFAGNERYIKQRAFEFYTRVPAPLRNLIIEPIVGTLPNAIPLSSKAKSYILQAKMPMPDRLQRYNFLHQHSAAEIFTDAFLAEIDTQEPLGLIQSIYHRPEHASDLNRMLYLDWQITLADNDLRKVTHMCSFAGIDVAYPLLDDALIEFSCKIPSVWKINKKDLRHFFKYALKDWLPPATLNKSKQGFGLPFGIWMQTYPPLRELAYDNLLKLKRRNFIRPEFIDKTIKMHQTEHAAYYGELVWIFTVFELWMESHFGCQSVKPEGRGTI